METYSESFTSIALPNVEWRQKWDVLSRMGICPEFLYNTVVREYEPRTAVPGDCPQGRHLFGRNTGNTDSKPHHVVCLVCLA